MLVLPFGDNNAAPLAADRLIGVPLDGSPGSSWSARVAATIAQATGATLLLLRVVQAVEVPDWAGYSCKTRELADGLSQAMHVEAENWLRKMRVQLPEGLKVDTQVVVAPVICHAIREAVAANDASLLVLSAHGLDADADGNLGEVAERLLARAPCSILLLQRRQAPVGTDVTSQSGAWRIPVLT